MSVCPPPPHDVHGFTALTDDLYIVAMVGGNFAPIRQYYDRNFGFVLFQYEAGMLSIRNSLVTSGLAATFGVLIGVVIAYLAERKIVRFGTWLAFLATAPLVIPGMVFAVGLFAAYSKGPVVRYGTLWILALAYLT